MFLIKNKYLPEKQRIEGKYVSFNYIKFPRGNYQRLIHVHVVPRHKQILYCFYCSLLNFLLHTSSKIMLSYFNVFWMKAVKAKCKFEKENRRNLHNTIFLFSISPLFYRKISQTSTICNDQQCFVY